MIKLHEDTPRFTKWVEEHLVACMPGGQDRWGGFPAGAYLRDADAWIVRGLLVDTNSRGATLWAFVAPLFDDYSPLSHRPLTFAAKQGWAARDESTPEEFAHIVATKWKGGTGEEHLARFSDPQGMLGWVHQRYRETAGKLRWSHGGVEAACHIIMGDLDAAMRAVTMKRDDGKPYHREEQFAQIRASIEAGPEAALARLQRIREEQRQSFLTSPS